MALIDCYECGKQVSDTALACPSCGALARRFGLAYCEKSTLGPFHKLLIGCLFIGAAAFGFCIGFIALSNGCSGQLIPDTELSFSSATAGASPSLN
jgi:hypothetical protein